MNRNVLQNYLPQLLFLLFSIFFLNNSYSQSAVCYSVSENNANNQLFTFDPATGLWSNTGPTCTNNIEAIAFDPINQTLYATDAGVLGTIDLTTGKFSAKTTLGPVSGDIDGDGNAGDVVIIDDIDGLSFDPVTNTLWASERRGGIDVIFQIDLATCTIKPDAFGPGLGYFVPPVVVVDTTNLFQIDDIAWDPFNNGLYFIQNSGTGIGLLMYLDPATGVVTQIGSVPADLEGLGLNHLGELFGSAGNAGMNIFFMIDETSGMGTPLSNIDPTNTFVDFESVDCLSTWGDLALTKVISPTQTTPIVAGDQVCFDISITNQGMEPNYNITLTDYIPTGLTLADPAWMMSGGNASFVYNGPLAQGATDVVQICFTVDAGFSGSITNTAEISSSEDVNGNPLPDIDSVPDAINSETNVNDNDINGDGPFYGEDEDDHDIAEISILPIPDCAVSSNSPICQEEDIILMETAGDAATWAWSGPNGFSSTNQNPTIVSAGLNDTGTFVVTVTDANGVTSSCEVEVVVNRNPTPEIDMAGPFCIDDASVTITATPLAGTFSGPGITAAGVFDPAAAGIGTHTITYTRTNSNGCTGSTTTEITVVALPAITLTPAGPFCESDAAETLSASPSGGTWSGTGVTGAGVFTPATAGVGTHTVTYTFTNSNGCTSSETMDIVVNPDPVVTIDPSGPFCISDNATTLSASPAGGMFSGMGVTDGSTGDFDPTIAGTGTHTIMYSFTNANGCMGTAQMDIVVNPDPVLMLGSTTCSADLLTYEITLTTDGDAVTATAGTVSGGAGSYTVTAIPMGMTISITSSFNGTSCETMMMVVAPDCTCPDIDLPTNTNNVEICEGEAIPALTATVPAGQTVDWYDMMMGGTLLMTGPSYTPTIPSTAGTYVYYAEARDIVTGCVSSSREPVMLLINPLPSVTIAPAGPLCIDESPITLMGMPSGGTYSGTGVTDASLGTFDPATAGVGTHTIDYTYTDANGCTNAAMMDVVVNGLPAITLDPAGPFCIDDAPINLVANPTGGQWNGSGITDSTLGTFDPAVAGVGNHTVTYAISDANGCMAEAMMMIEVSPLPVITLDAQTCSTDLTTYSVTITTDGDMVTASLGSVAGGAGSYTVSMIPAGSAVTVIAEFTATTCTAELTINAPMCDCPNVEPPSMADSFVICEGDLVPVLSSTVGANETVDWYDMSSGGTLLLAGSTTYQPTISSTPGVYVFYAETVDLVSGCVSPTRTPGQITINALPVPTITAAGPFCEDGGSVDLVATPVGGVWAGDGITDINLGTFDPLTAGVGTHTISYTYVNGDGCEGVATIDLIVNPTPVVTIDPVDPICTTDGNIFLTANPIGGTWSGLGIVDAATGEFDPALAGAGPITVTYVYSDGCPATVSMVIPVEICTYDLALTKVVTSTGPYAPGDLVSYDICVVNQGVIAANNIEVTDYIPTGMTFASSADFTLVGADYVATIASIATGATECVSITLMIDANFTGANLINDAEITADDGDDVDSTPGDDATSNDTANNDDVADVSGGDDQDPEEIQVTQPDPVFDLALTKVLTSAGPFVPGDIISFDITVINQGDVAATSIVVTDYSPAGLIFQSSTSDANVIDNGNETFEVINLPSMTSQVIEVFYQIDPASTATSMVNDAEITSDSGDDVDSTPADNATPVDTANNDDVADVNGGDDQDPELVPITQPDPVFDLALTKVLTSAGPFAPGDIISFDITVINQGDVAATSTVVTDYSPAGLIFQSSTSDANVIDNGNETFEVINLPSMTSQVIEVFYQIDPASTATSMVNDAEITSDSGDDVDSTPGDDATPDDTANNDDVADVNGGDDQDPEMVPITQANPVFDLALTKVLTSAGPFAPGDIISFDITVINQGDVAATSTVVTDYSPAGLIFQSSTSDANVIDNGNETFEVINLPSNTSQVIEVFYQIDPASTATSMVNDAEITSDSGDDVDSTPGDDATPGDTANNDDVADVNGGDDQDPELVPITQPNPVFDLALTKVLTSAGPFVPGDIISFDITVINQGDVAATSTVVTDYSPAGLIFQSSTSDANVIDNGNERFEVINLPSNTSQVIEVFYQIDPASTATSMVNDAEITSDSGDDVDSTPGDDATPGDTANNDDVADVNGGDDQDPELVPITQANPVFDLALTKVLTSAGPFAPGDIISFDITVINQGDVAATSTVVTDYSPAGLIYQSSTSDANVIDNGNETFEVINLPSNTSQVIEVFYQIDPASTATSMVNDAEITSDSGDDVDSTPGDDATPDDTANNDDVADINGGDDQDPELVPITQPEDIYDLAIFKTVLTPGPYTPGSTLSYGVVVTNQGQITANNIQITDIPDADLMYVTSDAAALANVTEVSSLVFEVGTLAPGASEAVVLTFTIDPAFAGTTLFNDVQITADDGDDIDSDPNTDDTVDEDGDGSGVDDDEDSVPITVDQPNPVFDLALTKVLTAAGPFVPGDIISFDIIVFNQGDIDATSTVVTDYSPAGLIYQSSTSDANVIDNGNETFEVINLPAMTSQTIEVFYQIDPATTATSIINDVEITSDSGDDVDSTPGDNATPDDTANNNDITDAAGGDDQDPAEVMIEQANPIFDLAMTKVLTSTGPFAPGDVISFDITVINQGDIDATSTVVTDNSPAGLIYQSSTSDANVIDNGNETFEVINLPSMTSQVITVFYQIDPATTATSMTNDAEITSDSGDDVDSTPGDDATPGDTANNDDVTDINGGDDQDPEVVPITLPEPIFDLALTKELTSVGPFSPGDVIAFDLTLFNQGDVVASNTEISDYSPAGLLFQSSTSDANVIDNGNETFTVINLAPGMQQVVEVFYQIDPNITTGQLINDAEITAASGVDVDSTPGDNSTPDDTGNDNDTTDTSGGDDHDPAFINIVVDEPIFDLALTKVLTSVGPFAPGDIISYEFTVFNQGDVDATSTVITDNSPAALIYQSSTSDVNVIDNGNETFEVINLPAMTSQTIEVFYQIDPAFAGASLINDAEITADSGDDVDSTPGDDSTPDDTANNDDITDTNGGDDQDPESIMVVQPEPVFDLALTKDLTSVGPYAPGDVIEFTITLFNQGAVDATSTVIADYNPAGLIYQSSTSDANVIDNGNGTFEVINLQSPLSGSGTSMQTIEVFYQIDPNTTAPSLINDAEIIADSGDDIDSTPDDGATPNDLANDNDLSDTNGGDDQDPAEVLITFPQPEFDLALTKELTTAGPHVPGDVISFEITVFNQGDADATNTVVTDYSPAGLNYLGSSSDVNVIDNANETFTVVNLAPMSQQVIEVFYQIDPATTATSLINDAEITADSGDDVDSTPGDNSAPNDLANNDDTTDTNGGDDQDPAEIFIEQTADVFDLALAKTTTSAGPYLPGDAVAFQIEVFNQGNVDATSTIVTDYNPAGLIYQTSTSDANVIDNGDGTFEIINLPASTSQVIELFYLIDPATIATSMTNDAEITSDSGDDVDSTPGDNATPSDIANNDDIVETGGGDDQDPEVILITQTAPIFDLALTKVLTSVGPFAPGDVISFDITVENQGDIDATSTVITDYSPAGLIYQSSTSHVNVIDNGNETFEVINIPSMSSQVIELFYQIDPTFTGASLVNDAEITSDNGDDVDSNPATNNTVDENGDGNPDDDDEDSAQLTIQPAQNVYDLALTKVLTSTGPFNPGDQITFEIVLQNQGDIDAANIVVADNSPTDLIFLNSTSNANVVDNGDETFTILNLATGTSQVIEVFYQIDANFAGTSLVNTAEITSDDGDDVDSNPATNNTVDENGDGNPDDDDEDTAQLTMQPTQNVYDLALTKVLTSAGPFAPGDIISFDIIVVNQGTLAAANVSLVDNSPASLIYQSSTASANVVDNGNEEFSILNIAAGSSQVIELFYQIDPNFRETSLVNSSQITADDGDDVDSDPTTGSTVDEDGDGNGDDDDEDEVSVIVDQNNPVYDLALNKTLTSTGPFVPGDIITFEITVNNQGAIPSNVVTVEDLPPTGLIYQGLTSNPNVSDNGGGVFTVVNVATGSGVSMELTYMIDPNFAGGTIINNAEITTDDGDDVDSDPNTGIAIDEDGDGNGDDDDEDSASLDVMSMQDIYDLALTKTLTTAGPFIPGDLVVFDIVIENQGGINANSVVVTESPPADLNYQFVAVDSNVTDNGDGTFTIWTIPAAGSQTIQLTYEIDPNFAGGSLTNYAYISADDGDDIDSDPNTDQTVDEDGDGNADDDDEDSSTITIDVAPEFDLALTKSYTSYTDLNADGVVSPGDDVVFSITIMNQGGVDANNVEIVDYLPGGTSLSINDTNGWTMGAAGAINIIPSITVANPIVTMDIVLSIDPTFAGTSLVNWAEISEDNNDDIDSSADSNNTDAFGGTDIVDGTNGDEDDHDDAQVDVEYVLASIGQFIWKDQNGNGMQDLGEPGIADVMLELYDCSGNIIDSQTTSASGEYLFDNLQAGDYQIRIDLTSLPAGCSLTAEDQGEDLFDSDFNAFGFTPCITLVAGENNISVAAGFIELASLGNFVWEDLDGNGIQDAGEPGVEGVQVILRNTNDVIVATQFTDSGGMYLFENLEPGAYYVEFNLPFGYSVSFPNMDSNNTSDSDVDNSNGSNTTPLTSLSAGENDFSWDAGIHKCIPIGDLVWHDVNENDMHDTSENGVNGLRVNLFRQMANGQYILWDYEHTGPDTNSPSDDGYFKFCAPPGTYYLEFVSPPTGLVPAQANVGLEESDSDITGSNGPGTTDSFTVLSGEEKCDLGAGYYAMGTLGDFVFLDDNQNGLRDANESGLGNVFIQAYNQQGQVMGEAMTNPDGSYMMEYLQQTDVYLKFYPPAGYSATLPNMGAENMDSDIDNSNGPMTTQYYDIQSGEHVPNVDAGLILGVVPVQWTDFYGENKNNHNWLQWDLAMEFNVSHYEVEKSLDVITGFEAIGKVMSIANNNTEVSYNYEDYDIEQSGTYYYRIKQIDLNGDYSYSTTIAIDRNDTAFVPGTARIYPNPSIGEFSIDIEISEQGKNIDYMIYGHNGKLAVAKTRLAENVAFGKHVFILDETQLTPGLYTIQLNIGRTVLKKKLIIIQ